MLTRRNIMIFAGLLALLAGVLTALGLGAMKIAQADQWPSRPITMVVPFVAGGPSDVVGRIVADRLSDVLGQQVIVENIGGAGGMNGAQRVALANPDGYQVLLAPWARKLTIRRCTKSRSTTPSMTSRRLC